MDACFIKQTSQATTSIVGRNCKGDVVTGSTRKMYSLSPLMAEATAQRDALSLAVNLQMTHITVENDNLDLVNSCRGECERGEIRNIIQDVLILKAKFQKCGFTWVGRNGNKLAHSLALLEFRDALPQNWRWVPPREIKEIIASDKGVNREHHPLSIGRRSYLNSASSESCLTQTAGLRAPPSTLTRDMNSDSAPSSLAQSSFPPDAG